MGQYAALAAKLLSAEGLSGFKGDFTCLCASIGADAASMDSILISELGIDGESLLDDFRLYLLCDSQVGIFD